MSGRNRPYFRSRENGWRGGSFTGKKNESGLVEVGRGAGAAGAGSGASDGSVPAA